MREDGDKDGKALCKLMNNAIYRKTMRNMSKVLMYKFYYVYTKSKYYKQ